MKEGMVLTLYEDKFTCKPLSIHCQTLYIIKETDKLDYFQKRVRCTWGLKKFQRNINNIFMMLIEMVDNLIVYQFIIDATTNCLELNVLNKTNILSYSLGNQRFRVGRQTCVSCERSKLETFSFPFLASISCLFSQLMTSYHSNLCFDGHISTLTPLNLASTERTLVNTLNPPDIQENFLSSKCFSM